MKISTDRLYCLCNKHQWFTNGDNAQYDLLFRLNKQGASLEKLATVIYVCSSGWDERDILKILLKEADI